ncbi:aspartate/glutamate racemase family protein [Acidimangrovimonas sediminis]|uniref:aspartate/glutamate racemase family protein n=1 Tax=Acidimangrovimonas sediminis TaxID=2056283 RepID=UPI000C7F9DE4|nr:aspartate/glutamate racemase family protein [Acidimangrovimonas sediminis]
MSGPILVINPNSNPEVTAGLDRMLEAYRLQGGPEIECLTLAEGPFGIESQRDSDSVILPLARLVKSRQDAAAVVLACYSDPGIDACREATSAPVYGIQECSVLTALTRGERFGVIAIGQASVARHRRYMRRMGLIDRLAGERPLNLSVADTTKGGAVFDRMAEVGRELIGDGADVLILGCAGMVRHRQPLQEALGVEVIDPVQAAMGMALGRVLAG